MNRISQSVRGMALVLSLCALSTSAGQKIIGYFPNWSDGNLVNTLPYNQLTHINWAFVYTNQSGAVTMESWEIADMEAVLHKSSCRGCAVCALVSG